MDRRVLGQDRDAALALELVAVHGAFLHPFVGAEHAALVQQGVHQRGLAVVDVGDDGDVAPHRIGDRLTGISGRRHLISIVAFRGSAAVMSHSAFSLNDHALFKRQTSGSVVCTSCGSLVGVRDDKCLNCGRRNPGLWGFAPLLRSLGNDLGFVQLVIWGCGALYIASLLLSGGNIGVMGGNCSRSFAPSGKAFSAGRQRLASGVRLSAAGGRSSARAGSTAACCTSSST